LDEANVIEALKAIFFKRKSKKENEKSKTERISPEWKNKKGIGRELRRDGGVQPFPR